MRKVNPNRMELLRLKKRKILAVKGHSLLEDKLEKLILEYHRLIKEFKEKSQEFEDIVRSFFEQAIFLKSEVSQEIWQYLLEATASLELDITFRRLLNLNLPEFSFRSTERRYSPKHTPPQWDRVFLMREQVLDALFRLAHIYIAIEKTSQEILKTRRRVNSLEYILIPQIDTSISFIENKLAEIEREFLSQILRIKDLIRK